MRLDLNENKSVESNHKLPHQKIPSVMHKRSKRHILHLSATSLK